MLLSRIFPIYISNFRLIPIRVTKMATVEDGGWFDLRHSSPDFKRNIP